MAQDDDNQTNINPLDTTKLSKEKSPLKVADPLMIEKPISPETKQAFFKKEKTKVLFFPLQA